MKQKLLACDVDGTLIFKDDQLIQQTDLDAIKKFTDAGHIFALCTGRTLTWTAPILDRFNLPVSALILCNGSMIYEVKDTQINTIGTRCIPNNIGKEIIKYFYQLGNFSIYWDDGQDTYEIIDRLLEISSSIIQENYSQHITIEQLEEKAADFVTIGVTPFSADINIANDTKQKVLENWGNYVDAFRNQYFIDIAPIESSKGAGITYLLNHLQKDLEVYGIGDSFNDLSMFKTVGKENAFLMKHGDSELFPYAAHHVNSVADCIDILLS